MKSIIPGLVALFLALKSYALPLESARFKALGMLETGNNDFAVGGANEVSRYQVRPGVWLQYSEHLNEATNEIIARGVAARIMASRVAAFKKEYGHAPSDWDWCLLWHKPGHILTRHESISDHSYATRFTALLSLYKK